MTGRNGPSGVGIPRAPRSGKPDPPEPVPPPGAPGAALGARSDVGAGEGVAAMDGAGDGSPPVGPGPGPEVGCGPVDASGVAEGGLLVGRGVLPPGVGPGVDPGVGTGVAVGVGSGVGGDVGGGGGGDVGAGVDAATTTLAGETVLNSTARNPPFVPLVAWNQYVQVPIGRDRLVRYVTVPPDPPPTADIGYVARPSTVTVTVGVHAALSVYATVKTNAVDAVPDPGVARPLASDAWCDGVPQFAASSAGGAANHATASASPKVSVRAWSRRARRGEDEPPWGRIVAGRKLFDPLREAAGRVALDAFRAVPIDARNVGHRGGPRPWLQRIGPQVLSTRIVTGPRRLHLVITRPGQI